MTSRITGDEEFRICVRSKATGERNDGYIAAMNHEKNTIKRAILAHVPTTIKADRIMGNGLPQVSKHSMHLMQNLQEAIKPSPKSPAMMTAMKELIAENCVKRIPGVVRKENDEVKNRVGYHKAYLYVDANCECPAWWVRGLNERGDLKHLTYRRFSDRTYQIKPPRDTIVNKCLEILPRSPSPDLVINPDITPGTTRWLLDQLGMESNARNRKKIGSILKSYASRGCIGQINKKIAIKRRGNNSVAIFYKLS